MPTCKKCTTEFEISEEEDALRNSVCTAFETGPVPPPTQCPPCRMQRRMARRNERHLYTRKCDLTDKQIISIYPADAPFPVYDRTAWWSDEWDATSFGKDFDFGRPFFGQFSELQKVVPRAAINSKNVTNSAYSNFCVDSKNCYLSHCAYSCEDLLYCYWLYKSKNCIDCTYCFESEYCFDCTDCNNSYNCRSCVLSHNCLDSYFLYDCRACNNCFGCVGLRNATYCLFNEQLSEEEYKKQVQAFDLEDPETVSKIREKVGALKLKHPHRYSIQEKTEDCTGDYIFSSKNCHDCFQLYNGENCMYVADADVKDCVDGYHPGWSQFLYEAYSGVNQSHTAFCSEAWDGSDTFYCDTVMGVSHSFGCVGLKHKQYCVLNKQYTKEAYLELLPKIVEHMKQTGEWGEFFPIELSQFAYNESLAQENFPLTKEEAQAKGYQWKDPDPREYQPQTYQVPERIADVQDDILQAVLACKDCGKNYRLIAEELRIYREKKIPLPNKCPDCRHRIRLSEKNPRTLFERTCAKCNAAISTTYAPDRTEIVYCEKCYLQEVY